MNERDFFIIEKALSGVSVNKIAENLREKGIPTAKKTVAKVISDNGYTYDKKNSKWIHNNNVNVNEITKKESLIMNENVKTNVNVKKKKNVIMNENVNELFSNQEISILKEIIKERMEVSATIENHHDIYDEITKLKVESRKRKNKTFFIDEDITKEFYKIAKKIDVKPSQLVEILFKEFIDRYK